MSIMSVLSVAGVLLSMQLASSSPARARSAGVAPRPLHYIIRASDPRKNRKVMGPVIRDVQGVPAEPVDSFVYDGDGSTPISGQFFMTIDPATETGYIEASWTDEHGDWTFSQTRFIHPEHSSGVRISSSMFSTESFINEGITQNVYIHGDTTAGMPVLPTIFAYVASWGPADITLNGEPFENPYELPRPQWLAHAMVTEGVRGPDGTVRNIYGGIYDPSYQAEGEVDRHDLELHLVFHDERYPLNSNVPPLFQFFYHLVFENVSIQVFQADTPPVISGGEVMPPGSALRPEGRPSVR